MGRPSKGPRKMITVRLPLELVRRISQLNVPDCNGWITDAVERKLNQEETENGRQAQAETG